MKMCRLISFMAQHPVGQDLLIIESSLSHWLRHTTLCRIPLDEWSARLKRPQRDNIRHSQEADIHVPGRIRTRNPSKQAASDTRFRPGRYWDQRRPL